MQPPLPAWAVVEAGPHDRQAALEARRRRALQMAWTSERPLRRWARQRGWPTPWFTLPEALLAKMLESDDHFELALAAGFQLLIPKRSHTIPEEELRTLDAAYEEHSWRWLVEALREIRRAVDAGVVVHVGDRSLRSFGSFYEWADGRYHALEDDTGTAWIGDDSAHP